MRDIASGVAVVGMACRFPGAPTVEHFWRNLKLGREAITFFDEDELEPDVRQLSRTPGYVRAAAIVNDIDLFDAMFFKMSPREAALTDPQHRLFLECAWTALESAGYGDLDSRGAVVGCYAGSWASSYAARAAGQVATPADEFQALVGAGLDYLTTLVSYKLNLTGESVAVQTACSTSLVAVHYACQSLLNGDIDMALAGGVSVDARQKTGYLYQDGMIFSPDGHCRPFDRLAKGTVRGYGLGIVVLKRLEDAVRDRDHIHAVIRRTAVNNDGHYKVGYTAPSGRGQTDVITTAMVYADVRADTIGYVEAHGTGTPLGDPIEIEALARAFGDVKPGTVAVGSVKSNLGHLVEAAGVAGLIKTISALENAEIPATLHYTAPNPQIDFASTPFFVADKTQPWHLDGPRRASVSSFGIGGTNAHAVLEAWTQPPASSASSSIELVTLSAVTAESLAHMRVALADWLAVHLEASLGDVAFTLNTGRQAFRHRWACVASTKAELLRALTAEDQREDELYPDDDDEELASYWSGEADPDDLPQPGAGDAPAGWSVEHVAEVSPSAARFRPTLPVDLNSLQELAQRWSRGERIDFRPLYESRAVRRVPLPTYRFQRKRFWLDPPSRTAGPRGFGPWLGQAAAGAVGSEPGARAELLILGGETEELLRRRAHACRALASGPAAPNLSVLSLVASSQAAGAHRLAAVARTKEELVTVLDAYRRGTEDARLFKSTAPAGPVLSLASEAAAPGARIAFVFSGQGGQWWGMGRDLLRDEPVFRRTIEACAEVLDRLMGMRFMSIWRASETASRMGEIDIAQPAVFALQVALAALWRSWGIVPDCVVGQSLGEVAAAHVCGALSLEDALAVVHHRSRLMKRVAGQGRTASVELSMDEALRAIAGYEDRLGVAGSNAPAASVLSGSPDALEEVLDKLRARGVSCRELRVDIAAHSPHMDPLRPELEEILANITARPATVPIYSTVDVAPIDGEQLDAKYWGRNLREAFRFAATIERMAIDGHASFLELAPHPVLSHAVKQTLHNLGRSGTVLPSLHRDRSDRDVMLRSLGSLYADGHAVTWPPLEHSPAVSEAAAAAADQSLSVLDRVRALVADALLAQPEDLADDVPLLDLGMDSVTGLSLIAKLAASFGVQLDTSELLRLGSIAGIARRLERGPGAVAEPAAATARVPIRSTRDARADVVMFPGAGGTALMLAPWTSPQLIDGANISTMDPPGHGSDRRPPIRTMSELVDLYVADLIPAPRPLILVGYSLGGLIAYAVAHALERRGIPPCAIVVSHTLPPPIWREMMFSRGTRFEEVFSGLYESWGIDAQSRATFLESARADFEVAESYDAPSTKLAALTCVISSATDDFAPAHQLLGWSALCERVAHYAAEGGHWDFLDHAANRELLRSVYARTLQAAAAAERRPWGHVEVLDRWQASGPP